MALNSRKIDLECLSNAAITLWPMVTDFAKGKMVDATYKLAKKGLIALVNETRKRLGIDLLTKIFKSARELFPPELPEKGLLTSLRGTFEILTKEHRRFTKEAFIEVASDPKYEIGIPVDLVIQIYDHVASRLANYFIAIKGKDENRFREFVVKQLGTETETELTQVTIENLTTLELNLTTCFRTWEMTWETFQADIKKGQITILDTLEHLAEGIREDHGKMDQKLDRLLRSMLSKDELIQTLRDIHKKDEELTPEILHQLSEVQVANVTKSSRMDIQFDPNRFVGRKEALDAFQTFKRSVSAKLFLLLGEAGFGKTWLVSHWANTLQDESYPVFYVSLRFGIKNFFENTFGTNYQIVLRSIKKISNDLILPVFWILDGYDEVIHIDERRVILVDLMKWLEDTSNQRIVLTSRAFDWNRCRIVGGLQQSFSRLTWTPNQGKEVSFHLQDYSPEETQEALQQYNLPSVTTWTDNLQELAKFPLWIRLLAEWYDKYTQMPAKISKQLFESYFHRMQIKNREVRALANVSYELYKQGEFTKEKELDELSEEELTSLDRLNSAGILVYREDLFEPTIKLATAAFGWFGTAYYASILLKRQKQEELDKFFAILPNLGHQDQHALNCLFEDFHIPIVPQKREADRKAKEEADRKAKEELNRSEPQITTYQGVQLFQPEVNVLVEIERQINKDIPNVTQISYDTFGFTAANNHVTELGLYNQGLETLPESLLRLTQLQTLDLGWNQLNTVPESFDRLTQLQTLGLRGNQLSSLPESFGTLTNLQTLYLTGNKLNTLPESLLKLTGLQTLSLGGNQLKTLPESFGNLVNLKELRLYKNQFSSLPESFANLTNLQTLNLAYNQLKSLPESFSNLIQLQTLDLRYNQLNTLPESLKTFFRELKVKGRMISGIDHLL